MPRGPGAEPRPDRPASPADPERGRPRDARLTNGIANVGGGPWHLHPLNVLEGEGGTTTAIQDIWSTQGGAGDPDGQIVCSVPTTQFAFHPAHNHWHIGSVAQFGVHIAGDDGRGGQMGAAVVNDRGIAQSFKTTFCLIDWVKIDAQKTPDLFYFACDRNAPFQGVSVGWIDQYHHALEGQEIDLTGAPSGVYYLRVHVNDEGKFVESTRRQHRLAQLSACRGTARATRRSSTSRAHRAPARTCAATSSEPLARDPDRTRRGVASNDAAAAGVSEGRSAVEAGDPILRVGVGGVLKRALTTHSRPFCQAAVVGMSSAGSVSVSTFFRPRIVNR